ncbi:MAG: acyl-CoA dehydrogenase family protein [Acidimicrobiales bacterium]
MDLELDEDQQELASAVRAMLAEQWSLRQVRDIVERGETTGRDRLWRQMAELGWPALTVPVEHGGLGLGCVELAAVCFELGRAVAPDPFLSTTSQFVPVVREAGSPEQQSRFLAPVAAGERTGTVALAENSGRWDAPPATSGRVAEGGWVLDGTKRFVFAGDLADDVVVSASLPHGLGLLVIPREEVSARATPLRALDASRSLVSLDLTGVRVATDRLLSGPADPETALRRASEEAITALAMETVGTCQAIFDLALQHAKDRHQFGVPIGSFQAIKHKFADMLVALERARALCWFAALAIAEDDDRRSLATRMAKAAAGDAQRLIAQEGIQILGGIGYTWEHDMHLLVKRAKSGDALFGTAAEHRLGVADLIGL